MTAMIATASPSAVEISASEMPAATTEKPPVPMIAIDWNAVRIPTTVPNSPMNGADAPEVALAQRINQRGSGPRGPAAQSAQGPQPFQDHRDTHNGYGDQRVGRVVP